MNRWINWTKVVLVGSSLIAAATTLRAEPTADAGTTKSPAQHRHVGTPPALAKAITDLSNEAKAYMEKPDSVTLRSTSDYFKSGLPDGVNRDDIVAALAEPMSGNNFQVAYVKFQLLSGISGALTDDQRDKLILAYGNAPAPLMRFTGEAQTRNQIINATKTMKADMAAQVNDDVDSKKKPIDDANQVITDYRDALYGKLPVTLNTLTACLRDMAVRLSAGVDVGKMLTRFGADTDSWLATDATGAQANILLGNFRELEHFKGATILGKWDSEKGKMAWTGNKPASIAGTAATAIEKKLLLFVQHPQESGLHFKDK